jgi:hypothetical protein
MNDESSRKSMMTNPARISLDPEIQQKIEQLINTDPLYEITYSDKQLLWAERDFCKANSKVK